MGIEVNGITAICSRCGKSYGKRRGAFFTSYSASHKGLGFVPVCKECFSSLYNLYFAQCNDAALAMRQICRKFDLYWNQKVFETVERKNTNRTLVSNYIQKINTATYVGKCYDDTLTEEGMLWTFGMQPKEPKAEVVAETPKKEDPPEDEIDYEISDEIRDFWGDAYDSDKTYYYLEKRRKYWMSQLPEGAKLDLGAEAIIRQICPLELDITKCRSEGRDVDKLITGFDKLVQRLKSGQSQFDIESDMTNTPMGVWLYRFENKKPLPDKYKDSVLLRYVFTWMGHVLRMLGKKNGYEELYQREIDRLRVAKPEYEDDDEALMMEYMEEDGGADG